MQKLESVAPSEAAYYEGYNRGHRDTAKMLARRSLAFLFIGSFLGVVLTYMVFHAGLFAEVREAPAPEDPALTVSKPKEYVKAIAWAKQFTVGIVAETRARSFRVGGGTRVIPGQKHIGSGIILNAEGYILTNSHVIPEDFKRLGVVLGDNIYDARFVGHRPEYDIAVIKILAEDLKAASLGDSDKVEQGEVVIAIGSPYGLFHTATEGIISYVGRKGGGAGGGSSRVRNYLQTSAAINHGNSGGPLIDLTGRVIGINTWKLTDQESEGIDGIGFAIPINVARKVSDKIIELDDPREDEKISSRPRSLSTAYLGVIPLRGFRPEMPDDGVPIEEVLVHTPAEMAGIRAGDVITKIDGKPVTSFEELASAIRSHEPGARIRVTFRRDGMMHTVEVTLGK